MQMFSLCVQCGDICDLHMLDLSASEGKSFSFSDAEKCITISENDVSLLLPERSCIQH